MAGVLLMLATGCAGQSRAERETLPSPSIRTLTIAPLPSKPPTGTVAADMRQSSIDAAWGQMQVWVDNDTARTIRPRRIVYRDGRFARPLLGERLRPIPAQSVRGFPLHLPEVPRCDSTARRGTVRIEYAAPDGSPHRLTLPVSDPTDVPGRYLRRRCTELAVARVAVLTMLDEVPVDRPGAGGTGILQLRVEPTGADGAVELQTVSGTPLVSPKDAAFWTVATTVRGTDPAVTLPLPMQPARCDDHVFMEGGGSTAFKIALVVDGRPGQVVVRMTPEGARHVVAYIRDACGL